MLLVGCRQAELNGPLLLLILFLFSILADRIAFNSATFADPIDLVYKSRLSLDRVLQFSHLVSATLLQFAIPRIATDRSVSSSNFLLCYTTQIATEDRVVKKKRDHSS
ncbi:hypothetical protein H4Q26_003067 [Puccinia striiformis f. sp. tritici PST-130]|nr:hypothetical protein Pst134EB_012495 [Puccinia striiformis f. sp. tritici]KAI9605095.1 hypothetical protein H4Q26_003067 [Puccinia striiformis f. sp. tritici PST-130]